MKTFEEFNNISEKEFIDILDNFDDYIEVFTIG